MSEEFPVFCARCSHPFGDHDSYGCGHWYDRKHWQAGSMCGCSLTRRQLLQLDEVPS